MLENVFGFESFNEWFVNAPDMGREYSPKPEALTETYEEWLQAHPQGYVC